MKLLVCLVISLFILLFMIILCTDWIDITAKSDPHIRDPYTGEIVDDYYDK